MVLAMLYKYRASGEEASEFVAEKLSYFLQRFGEPQLKLDFTKGYYGPYSGKVRHVLYALNGFYLKGYEQKQAKPFEPLELVISNRFKLDGSINSHLQPSQHERIQKVGAFIKGFESPYGLELLATVDFATQETGTNDVESVIEYIQNWSQRKAQTFSSSHVQLAITHLDQHLLADKLVTKSN